VNVSFVEPLSRAGERTRNMLFGPFELVKWLVLGFSVWLANLANGGFLQYIYRYSEPTIGS